MELKDTIKGMTSPDYKERFKAEYAQLKIRIEKLNNFINRIENARAKGDLEPKHDCPLWLLKHQVTQMNGYLEILEVRAIIENADLSEV